MNTSDSKRTDAQPHIPSVDDRLAAADRHDMPAMQEEFLRATDGQSTDARPERWQNKLWAVLQALPAEDAD